MIKVGSDFSGVGAFNQALNRLGIDYEEIFACDMDKYARQTFIHNYGEPKYYPTNVYEREIPRESLDIYMTSPPCQAFSLAGKRLGKEDKRGILFFNSLEFIEINKPRYFIFENVKGLLSDDVGKTFSEWVNLLGGKSVNGNPILFPYEGSVPYHLYWQVLNAKEHGVPQNRERVFLIGIRDDQDNNFRFPAEEPLTKRLKDVLDGNVDEKYFLNDKKINDILSWNSRQNPLRDNLYNGTEVVSCLLARGDGNEHAGMKLLQIKSANKKGYEEATEGDSINFSVPNSETRRGGVGKHVAQTLDTQANQGVLVVKHERTEQAKINRKLSLAKGVDTGKFNDRNMVFKNQDYSDSILSNMNPKKEGLLAIQSEAKQVVIQYNDKRLNETILKNNLPEGQPMVLDTFNKSIHEECPTLKGRHAQNNDRKLWDGYLIRRLTPRECFRLMDFPDSFDFSVVSDSQAYKQAGNSIVVNVLYKIIKNLKL